MRAVFSTTTTWTDHWRPKQFTNYWEFSDTSFKLNKIFTNKPSISRFPPKCMTWKASNYRRAGQNCESDVYPIPSYLWNARWLKSHKQRGQHLEKISNSHGAIKYERTSLCGRTRENIHKLQTGDIRISKTSKQNETLRFHSYYRRNRERSRIRTPSRWDKIHRSGIKLRRPEENYLFKMFHRHRFPRQFVGRTVHATTGEVNQRILSNRKFS